ncbi:ParM/StbA family protein [Clostridium tyrobutyricum]|uniref:ParM/StbA family protein n=1 Tax=Clostridium tyrobutyricum TaxID=1519 RepID=UPI001C381D41|nr:ParM/StbA family protein [Clostridium tyrobutyricum]MBV4418282.1 ParM/StbA family protein [Clostridium tyrobutyricum]
MEKTSAKEEIVNNVVVIDQGNWNTKWINNKGIKGVFSSRVSSEYQSYEEGFQRIEYNEQTIFFEVGQIQKEFNKIEKWCLIPQILYTLCKANPGQEIMESNITLLLPAIQMQNKTRLIGKLKNKEFNFKYNGKEILASIHNVMILPEGYVSYFSLNSEDKKGSVALVDIGSRTVNLVVLHNGKIEKLNTITLGSYNFFQKIKNIENAKGENFVEEDIKRLIDEGIIKVYQKQYAEFLNNILDAIKPLVNLATYKVIFTGGTSLMLQEYINKLTLPNFKIHEDALNSNIIGAMEASKIILKDVVA